MLKHIQKNSVAISPLLCRRRLWCSNLSFGLIKLWLRLKICLFF
jgi:hypothetical protein